MPPAVLGPASFQPAASQWRFALPQLATLSVWTAHPASFSIVQAFSEQGAADALAATGGVDQQVDRAALGGGREAHDPALFFPNGDRAGGDQPRQIILID